MGQSVGKDANESGKQLFLNSYHLIEECEDSHYGVVKKFEQIPSESQIRNGSASPTASFMRSFRVAVKESIFSEPETLAREANLWKRVITQLREDNDQGYTRNWISVFSCFVDSEDRLCSTIQRLQILLEYLQRDLQTEAKIRRLQNTRFTPQEIFAIAFSAINALAHLQRDNISHSHLKSSKLLTSDVFEVKLLHPSILKTVPSFSSMITAKHTQEKFDTSGIYLSPLLTKSVAVASYTPLHNEFKSDVFTLGMILIELCTLSTVDAVYDYTSGDLRGNVLTQLLSSVKQTYGVDVHDMIAVMVASHETERPDFLQLSMQLGIPAQMTMIYTLQQKLIESKLSEQNKQAMSESLNQSPTIQGVQLFRTLPTEESETNLGVNAIHLQKQFPPPPSFGTEMQGQITFPPVVHTKNLRNIPTPVTQQQMHSNFLNNEKSIVQLQQENLPHISRQLADVSHQYQKFDAWQAPTVQQDFVSFQDNSMMNRTPQQTIDTQGMYRVQQTPRGNQFIDSTLNEPFSHQTYQQRVDFQPKFNHLQPKQNYQMNQTASQQIIVQQQQQKPVAHLGSSQQQHLQQNQFAQQQVVSPEQQQIYEQGTHVKNSNILIQDQLNPTSANQSHVNQSANQSEQISSTLIKATPIRQVFPQSVQTSTASNSQTNSSYLQQQQLPPPPSFGAQPTQTNKQVAYQYQANSSGQAREGYEVPSNVQNIIDQFKDKQFQNELKYEQELQAATETKKQSYTQRDSFTHNQQRTSGSNQYQNPINLQQVQQYPNQIQHQQITSMNRESGRQPLSDQSGINYQIQYSPINQQEQNLAFNSSQLEYIHETYDDHSQYVGEKSGGLRHGNGKFFYADGGYYMGEWREGRMEGKGTLYYPQGSLAYSGQWRNDQFCGKGTVYNESPIAVEGNFDFTNFDNLGEHWIKYEGDFLNDNKEGLGSIFLSNGDKFIGNFSNDFVHGQGQYHREGFSTVSGIWDSNHLVKYLQ